MKAPWLGGVAIVGALAGCYSPSIEPCIYACNDQACPNGLTCNNDHMCALAKGDRCVAGGDGSIADVSVDTSCGWPVTTNVDACALNAQSVNFNLTVATTDRVLVDTDLLTIANGAGPIGGVTLADVPQTEATAQLPHVALLRLGLLAIPAGATFSVMGKRPLVILVNGQVVVDGVIDVSPVMDMTVCPTAGQTGMGSSPTGMTGGAGGGGGGSYGPNSMATVGAAGGAGGSNTGANPVAAGANGGPGGMISGGVGPERLSPLHPGCPGGDGGARGANGLPGGWGGGALQISARTSISVGGEIRAPGGGGAGVLMSNMMGVGAGGGGSGGAILLEAPAILLANGKLCANGGGGGNGGSPAQSGLGGQGGGCTLTGAPGGSPTQSEGVGATATVNAVSGAGGVSATMVRGGSGGGGGVGRIRINGVVMMTGTPLSTPAFSHP